MAIRPGESCPAPGSLRKSTLSQRGGKRVSPTQTPSEFTIVDKETINNIGKIIESIATLNAKEPLAGNNGAATLSSKHGQLDKLETTPVDKLEIAQDDRVMENQIVKPAI